MVDRAWGERAEVKAEDTLRIQRPTKPVDLPPDRGNLMNAEDIAGKLLGGSRSPCWVRRNVPGKMDLGHRTKMWWEYDVIEWIDSTKDAP